MGFSATSHEQQHYFLKICGYLIVAAVFITFVWPPIWNWFIVEREKASTLAELQQRQKEERGSKGRRQQGGVESGLRRRQPRSSATEADNQLSADPVHELESIEVDASTVAELQKRQLQRATEEAARQNELPRLQEQRQQEHERDRRGLPPTDPNYRSRPGASRRRSLLTEMERRAEEERFRRLKEPGPGPGASANAFANPAPRSGSSSLIAQKEETRVVD